VTASRGEEALRAHARGASIFLGGNHLHISPFQSI